jgi:PPM family protein phosphatase
VKIVAYAKTDVGRWRPANEDSHLVLTQAAVYAVADGMGGHAAGEVASRIAVDTLAAIADEPGQDPVTTGEMLARAVNQANEAIAKAASDTPDYAGMGTTCTVIAFTGNGTAGAFAHVGDTRLYRLRGGALQQITRDHTWVQDQVSHGNLTPAQARSHPLASMLSRALGTQEEIEVDVGSLEPNPGDVYLLCSDGLTNMLTDDLIKEFLVTHPEPKAAAERLVDEANDRGGRDNITALVVRLDP